MANLYQEIPHLISEEEVTCAAGRQIPDGLQGTGRKAMRSRFHPYGARLNVGPPSSYTEIVEGPSYWPGFNGLPSIDFLSNDLSWQTNTLSHPNTLHNLQSVCSLGIDGNISSFKRTALTSASIPGQRRLQQNHPFYLRQRKSPVEWHTRTRDKYRVVYTEQQRKGLERAYEQNKFISLKTKVKLAQELDLSDRQIKIWFQNRRAKERRQKNKESEDYKENHIPSREDSTLDSSSGNDVGNWSPIVSEGMTELPSYKFPTAARIPPMDMQYFGKHQWGLKNKKNSSESSQFPSHSVKLRSSTSVQDISPSKLSESELLPHTNLSPLSFNLGFGYACRL